MLNMCEMGWLLFSTLRFLLVGSGVLLEFLYYESLEDVTAKRNVVEQRKKEKYGIRALRNNRISRMWGGVVGRKNK